MQGQQQGHSTQQGRHHSCGAQGKHKVNIQPAGSGHTAGGAEQQLVPPQ